MVKRGNGDVSSRDVVKLSWDVHRCALLSNGTGNVVCSTMSWWGTTEEV